jgi:hypothetical protein
MDTPTNISSSFAQYSDARAAVGALRRQAAFAEDEIDLIEPGDPAVDRKFLPDSASVRRSLVRWHLVLGAAGLAVGGIAAIVLIKADLDPFALSPGYTFLVTVFFGTLAGLLLGGLVSIRPDQGRAAAEIKDLGAEGCWTVVVHCRNQEQAAVARRLLDKSLPRH